METTVEALEGNQKKLTITIDAADVDERIKKQYKDFAVRYNFPGFRRGKAPRPVIDNALGKEAVRATVTDDVVNTLYPLAMDEADLIATAQPAFDLGEDELVVAGQPFTFTVTVETRPEFDLSSYDAVTIKLPSAEATEDEVNAQIDELRNYYYTFEDCADDVEVADGAFAEIAMSAKDAEGNAIDSLSSDSRLYEVGGGMLPESFDDALKGMKKGDTKTFDVDLTQPSVLGRNVDADSATFDVEVKQVKEKVLPELTDDWARETAGFEGGVEELRTRVGESIKQQKEQMLPRLRENEALFQLQTRLQGEAPAGLAEAEEQNLLQTFFMQMQQSGMTFDAYLAANGLSPETFSRDLKRQARDVVKQDLALDAWARNAGIEVTDEEITAEFEKSGAEDPAALEAEWRANGRIAMLRAGMKRTKAIEQILENLQTEELAEGEKLLSVQAAEAEDAAAEAAEQDTAEAAPEAEDTPASVGALSKTELNKLKVAELRDIAEQAGVETEGLKKAELVDAILAAQ